jgi:integrase
VQKGRIYKHGNSWVLRYRLPIMKDGQKVWKDCYQSLAPINDSYKSVRSVEHLAKPYLEKANVQRLTASTTQPVRDFIEYRYFPHVEQEGLLAPSTIFGYRHMFEKHLKNRLGNVYLCDFDTPTARKLLQRIAMESGLSHTSLKHHKWFLAAVFKYAINEGAFKGINPIPDVQLPKGASSEDTYAYSLKEILAMLEALAGEPTAATVIATAAFTGLRRSELRGLRWTDLRGDQLFISRTVWNTHERDKTKTAENKAPVPIVGVLQKYLEDYRNGFPSDGFIFAGPKKPTCSLNLANLARRIIVPTLKKAGVEWHGWHAFRRGLATNLYCLGVKETTIQAIMRHADIETTRRHYIQKNMVLESSQAAMREVEKVFTKMRKESKSGRSVGTNLGTAKSTKANNSQ